MSPPFLSDRQTLGFSGLILLIIALPLLLHAIGPSSRDQVYRSLSTEAGEGPFIAQEIFENHTDLDVLFLGNSSMWRGIDAPYFQRELSRKLGREAKVLLLGMNWPGMDLQYALLKDFLEHRRTRLVVLSMPNATLIDDRPHVQASHWLRYGEFREATAGLPLHFRVSLYASAVLGAPRQFVGLLRHESEFPEDDIRRLLGSREDRVGYYGEPFTPEPAPEAPPPEDLTYGGSNSRSFQFSGKPLGPYQLHFVQLMADLAQKHGVQPVLIHIPDDAEFGEATVTERMAWPEVFHQPLPMVGIPANQLFPDMSKERFQHFFSDWHLNLNGKLLFTRAITPTLLKLYGR